MFLPTLIEKYLNDSVAGKERNGLAERIIKTKLIPKLMQIEIDKKQKETTKRDSLNALLEMDKEEKENADTESEDQKIEIKKSKTPTKKIPQKTIKTIFLFNTF